MTSIHKIMHEISTGLDEAQTHDESEMKSLMQRREFNERMNKIEGSVSSVAKQLAMSTEISSDQSDDENSFESEKLDFESEYEYEELGIPLSHFNFNSDSR